MGGMLLLAARAGHQILSKEWLLNEGVVIGIALLIGIILSVVARLVVRRLQRKLDGTPNLTGEVSLRRTATVTHSLLNFFRVVIWTVVLLIVIDQFGVSLAPLLATAGIAGVALGFGAQSLVRDGLSGFFILLENQFDVGDTIEAQTVAGPIAGRVEAFTMRVTSLRAFDGTLHIIPNGNIQVVSNKTRGWARAIVDVRLANDEDVERVRGVLDELFADFREQDAFKDSLMSGPDVLGVERLADTAIVIRVVAETLPSRRFDVERQLREQITARFSARGVRVPVTPAAVPTGSDG
jgi:moderate conductance mechanosensitive channel